jgi:hypothetical protein
VIAKRTYCMVLLLLCGACGESGSTSTAFTPTSQATVVWPTTTGINKSGGVESQASGVVRVRFDNPGADPRPIKEIPVEITSPTARLAMRITDLTYRGIACGFTFTGVRPRSPVTITVEGKTAVSVFSSGPVSVAWTQDGVTTADSPQSNNGWSFSADAVTNRNGPGWVVTIGAVTSDGPNSIPTEAQCVLRSGSAFEPKNGPVGYWAGFATR